MTSARNCKCITKSMSIWLILFLVQVAVYAVARQPNRTAAGELMRCGKQGSKRKRRRQ